jgi:hypothetical protein
LPLNIFSKNIKKIKILNQTNDYADDLYKTIFQYPDICKKISVKLKEYDQESYYLCAYLLQHNNSVCDFEFTGEENFVFDFHNPDHPVQIGLG